MAQQFCLILYTKCYAELIDPKVKIDSLKTFLYFPCNLMTKYGHESGIDCHFSVTSWN